MAVKSKKKPVSIRDVAKKAGVSRSTVSLVLNNSPIPKEETRHKVLEVVKQLNYQPDPLFGQAIRRRYAGGNDTPQKTQTIGFCANDFLLGQARVDDGYYSRVLAGIQLAAEKYDYHLMIKSIASGEEAPPAMVAEHRVDGLVVEGDLPGLLLKILADRLPIAIIDRVNHDLNIDSVMPNIEKAVQSQLAYLWGLGHRNIAMFVTANDSIHRKWQERAFYQFFQDIDQPIVNPKLCERHDINEKTHDKVMAAYVKKIVQASPRPTALISWDVYACSLLSLLQEHGLRVPEDISLIGMDDTLDSQKSRPQLSTYRFSMEDMGRSATELLIQRINDRSRPVHQIMIDGKLIERATCAAVPGSP